MVILSIKAVFVVQEQWNFMFVRPYQPSASYILSPVGTVRTMLMRQRTKIMPRRNLFTEILSNLEMRWERATVAAPPIVRQTPM
jgi:hypothetical protein